MCRSCTHCCPGPTDSFNLGLNPLIHHSLSSPPCYYRHFTFVLNLHHQIVLFGDLIFIHTTGPISDHHGHHIVIMILILIMVSATFWQLMRHTHTWRF